MTAAFVHLRLHTEYSISDGIVRIPALVAQAKSMAMPAIAVSDHMNMFGLVKFYKQALQQGIKPLICSDIQIYENGESYLLSLYALNTRGYQNIRELISKAYQENLILGRAYVKREWLVDYTEGVLVLSGAKFGDIGQALLLEKPELAESLLAQWMALFPQRFYLELQRTGRAGDEKYLHAAAALAEKMYCPVVATNDVRFLHADEFEAHEARVCIHESRTLNDPRRERKYSEQQYFKNAQEMSALFADIPEALENTLEIAKRCSVQMELGKNYLPDFPIPDGLTLENFFRDICAQGLEKRFAKDIRLDEGETRREKNQYWARLHFEIDIILQMGFPGYFLIVMDFIRWAKEQDIPVGPGRGSGAGSLVAYALEITDLDPLQYDLLFERFLNPERISMPDFDVDFCQERRDEVIQYVADTYGKQAVSQIITFGTMAAKAVVRDVARVQGKPYGLADKLSKMIPFAVGMTLATAYESEPDIQHFLEEDSEAQGIWDMAVQLEGVVRNTGKHAAGVVIAPNKLEDFTPVYCVEGEDVLISQFDKDDVEDVGLVKFDFLGLKNLTVIQWALKIINACLRDEHSDVIDISQIPLADPKVFALLQKAQTTAVFQLESHGMKDLIARLKPSTFEDIIALVALYRPGPLESGMVDDFINRKHGKQELAYPHPKFQHACLVPVLKPTYGIILYQEQVMQIAQVMGGYSLGAADMLRRAMGKKKAEEMAQQREQFVNGSVAKGFNNALASNIFDLMEKFAGYGFNKSHSAAYALVAYQTAWLKAHYPAAFMAAVMSADLQNTDKIVTLIEECRHMKLNVLPPDINQGQYLFTVDADNSIIYGLGAIKGLGEGPVTCLIAEREQSGAYTNVFDLCSRTDSRKLNKRALEAIVLSGAMDSLGEERSLLMESLPEAMQAAEQKTKNADAGITDLFGDIVSSSTNIQDVYESFRRHETWSLKQKLQGEKETLGLYLTGHPIDIYAQEVSHLSNARLAELKMGSNQRILALIISLRTIRTKRGSSMVIVTLDDCSARIEMVLFSEMYERYRELLVIDDLIVVDADVEEDKFTGGLKLNAQHIYSIEQMRAQKIKMLSVVLSEQQWSTEDFCRDFETILRPFCVMQSHNIPQHAAMKNVVNANYNAQVSVSEHHGMPGVENKPEGCRVLLVCQLENLAAQIALGPQWRIKPSEDALRVLRKQFGDTHVKLIYE